MGRSARACERGGDVADGADGVNLSCLDVLALSRALAFIKLGLIRHVRTEGLGSLMRFARRSAAAVYNTSSPSSSS